MQHLLKRFASTVGTHEKDITLYLWMASYFLRYFNLRRHEQLRLAGSVKSEESAAESRPMPPWSFGLVGTSLELDTLRYVILKVRTEYMVAETKVRALARPPARRFQVGPTGNTHSRRRLARPLAPPELGQRSHRRQVLARSGT